MRFLTIAIFLVILGVTIGITYWAARRTRTASEFYTAGRQLGAAENGFALAGDWMSAAAFLGFSGLVALYGMDGSLYAVAALVAFLLVLLVIAEPLRNTGKYTLADVIAYRMQRPQARLAAVVGTVVVNLAYLIPQMVGAGALAKLLLGIPYSTAVVLSGVAMVLYVAFGGMLATTWVQIVKAVLLLAAAAVLVFWILAKFGFNPVALFDGIESRYGAQLLSPNNYLKNPWDQLSLGLGFAFGTAGLPHVMIRFYTVRDAKTARKSVIWVMFLAGAFFMATTLIGFAAAYYVGRDNILQADKGGNLALPLLAQHLAGGPGSVGGQVFLAFVSAVAFATIVAVVAGLTLATAGAIAHDVYVNVIKGGHVDERTQVRVARMSTLAVGAVAIALGLLAQGLNVAVLVVLAIAVAASCNFPIVALSLFWRRFNAYGVIGGVTFGLVSAVGLAFLGPAFQGANAVFPLVNPTVLSMPLGFLGAVLGTLLQRPDDGSNKRFDEVVFRAQTGVGAEA
ncbi:solute symporter family protein [Geodermatophilus chilensis]|uniref:solute symporter family protein n=1 Tax=Geodermatophilus chilensis TaxID=2035835 RepID=UPI000C259309|nr:cation acetate symporter [Geodermatophilus chilensis]